MGDQSSRILLVENYQRGMSPTMAQLARDAASAFRLNLCGSLSEASFRLENGSYDMIITGLDVEDSKGVDTVNRLLKASGETPLAVIFNNDQWAMQDELTALGVKAFYPSGSVDLESVFHITNVSQVTPEALSEESTESEDEELSETSAVELQEDTSHEESNQPELIEEEASEPVVVESVPVEPDLQEEAEDFEKETDKEPPEEEPEDQPVSEAELPDLPDGDLESDAEQGAAVFSEQSAEDVSESAPEIDRPEEPAAFIAEQPLVCAEPVEDQIPEVHPEAGNLSEQSQSAGLSSELQDQYEQKIAELTAELDASVERHKKLQATLEDEGALRKTLAADFEQVQQRCAELEAGQTALIEAEHVAIEREKSARELAEKRVWDLEERLKNMESPRELENQISRLSNELKIAEQRAREAEHAPAAQVQLLQNQIRKEREEHKLVLENAAKNAESIQSSFQSATEKLKELQWQVKESEDARIKAEARAAELEHLSAKYTEAAGESESLREQLENANLRRSKVETLLSEKESRCIELSGKIERLEALVNQLHTLADKADEADKIAADLEQMNMLLATEKSARRRLNAELRKAQALKEKLAAQQESIKSLQWSVKEKEQALGDAQALVDELKLGGGTGNAATLQEEVKALRSRLAAVEKEKQNFSRTQMAKLEELKALYEKSQSQRMELSAKLSERKKKK